jgi:hypothetical protein
MHTQTLFNQYTVQLLYGLQFPLEICLNLHSFELFIYLWTRYTVVYILEKVLLIPVKEK